ncbi:hypothetical protein BKA64DRAFT_764067 [Cadophora sp. MPI-SDFR-AT-0126]|nr:hypothetical protein BKA64DRAFT_764067 [Leotiomycetes sp. MPI-SDFR-AT-0126]
MTGPVTDPINANIGHTLIMSQFSALSIGDMQRPLVSSTNDQLTNATQHTASPVQVMKRARQPSLESSESPPIKRHKDHIQQNGIPYASEMEIDIPASQPGDSSELMGQENTQSTPKTGVSHGLLFESNLPTEVRDIIHAHALALRPGICPPTLLEVTTRETRHELLQVYRQVNHVVRKSTYDTFRKIPFRVLNQIRHLTLVYEGSTRELMKQFFRSDKTQLINHFTTLTIDLSGVPGREGEWYHSFDANWVTVVQHLIVASQEGVEKITFVFAAAGSYAEKVVRPEMDKMFGFPSNQIPDEASGRSLHVLVWEGRKTYMKLRARMRK